MATVTALTAEETLRLLGLGVVGGTIVGDNLVLTLKNGTTVNAGNVRGPAGPTGGISEAAATTLINNAVGAAGKGMIDITEVQVNQDFAGFMADAWQDLDDMELAFEPVTGRNLGAKFQVQLNTEDPSGCRFHARIIRDGGIAIASASLGVSEDAENVVLNGSRDMVIPAWGGEQTFKLQVMTNSGFAFQMKATDVVCSMSFEDKGIGVPGLPA